MCHTLMFCHIATFPHTGLEQVSINPSQAILLLELLNSKEPHQLMDYADVVVASLCGLLEADVPRKVKEMVVQLWRRLNTIIPRR